MQDRVSELVEYIKFCEKVLGYEEDPVEIYDMMDAIHESKQELKELGYPKERLEELSCIE